MFKTYSASVRFQQALDLMKNLNPLPKIYVSRPYKNIPSRGECPNAKTSVKTYSSILMNHVLVLYIYKEIFLEKQYA